MVFNVFTLFMLFTTTTVYCRQMRHHHNRHMMQSYNYNPFMWVENCINKTCPRSSLERCDFYFNNSKCEIPIFNLTSLGYDLTEDIMIPETIMENVLYRSIDISQFQRRNACVLNKTNNADFTNLFYGGSYNRLGKIFINATVLNLTDMDSLKNSCVLLYLPQVRPHWANKATTLLVSGDKNDIYHEDRRCVVFKVST